MTVITTILVASFTLISCMSCIETWEEDHKQEKGVLQHGFPPLFDKTQLMLAISRNFANTTSRMGINISGKNKDGSQTITIMLLLLCGDVHANPGPVSVYPCGYCEYGVNWSQKAICCDDCSIWYHKSCIEMCTLDYDCMGGSSVEWICTKCDAQNHSSHLFRTFDMETQNSFAPLNSPTGRLTMDSAHDINLWSPSSTTSFRPQKHSSPYSVSSSKNNNTTSNTTQNTTDDHLPPKKTTLRTLSLNANSIQGSGRKV